MEKGIFDGIFINLETLKVWRLAEVVKYVNLDIQSPTGSIPMTFFNEESFNNLPADIQKVFMDSRKFLADEQMRLWVVDNQEGIDFAKEEGVEFIDLPPTELEKWQNVLASLASQESAKVDDVGKPGTEILEETLRLIEQYSK